MDHAAAVAQAAPVRVEQAVFTSIRSPMGEGYRLIATSRGVTPEDRQELTRRSPSHGSLCADEQAACGLASYPLGGGRWCVAGSMHAGLEHTARGGRRVYTHIVIFQRGEFERFDCDPVRVHAELGRVLNGQMVLEQRPGLTVLELDPRHTLPGSGSPVGGGSDQRILTLLGHVVGRTKLAVLSVEAPLELLSGLVQVLPMARRRELSLSAGLKYSPARDYDLLMFQDQLGDRSRLEGDGGRVLCDWTASSTPAPGPGGLWVDLVRRLWQAGREDTARRLARGLIDGSAAALQRIVALQDDIDRLPHADAAATRVMYYRHEDERPLMPLHGELLAQFQQTLAIRQRHLEHLGAAGSAQKNGPPPICRTDGQAAEQSLNLQQGRSPSMLP